MSENIVIVEQKGVLNADEFLKKLKEERDKIKTNEE